MNLSMRTALVFKIFLFVALIACMESPVNAQQDTSRHKHGIVGFLKKQKGIVGRLAGNLVGDTAASDLEAAAQRNDLSFVSFEGKIIRNIEVQRLDFGTLITDTAHNFKNTFTKLANSVHHKSREFVIRNNLFFRKGDRLQPYLMADNERHLRDQPYIQDAKIFVFPSNANSDSVDILIRTKDVLSIGGTIEIHNPRSVEMSVKEENLGGSGSSIAAGLLYNQIRHKQAGYAAEYIYRNIGGSFIDAYAGFSSFANTFNTAQKEEELLYIRLVKPLVNPYSKWSYSFEAANHVTQNMFWSDSFYHSAIKYHYFNYDGWIGWNTGAYKLAPGNEDDRLRTLVSLRILNSFF